MPQVLCLTLRSRGMRPQSQGKNGPCDRPRPTSGMRVVSQPFYLFCLIPVDTPFVFPRCDSFLCSVSLTCSTVGCPKAMHHQTQHHQQTHAHTIYTTSSTQHHQHNLINKPTSSQHYLHNAIYTTPSTQHHLHYIIKHLQVEHLEHCHFAPSASFLLIPLFVFFVVDCSLFYFVGLFHIWMSEDIVNMWGYPVL